MGILSWLLFGLIAGGIAKLIMPGKDPGGCLITALIGMLGSVIGGFLGNHLFGFEQNVRFDLRSLGVAILGAIVLLLIYRLFLGRRPRHS
ncbi:MAG TPA: GlsB/YeaQ/YmgE family stress response membrane protein [Longimicrobiales bacterium]